MTGLVSVASIAGFKRHLARVERRPVGRRLVRPRRRVRLRRHPRRRRRPARTRSRPCPASRPRHRRDRRRLRGHRHAIPRRATSVVRHREEPPWPVRAVVIALPAGGVRAGRRRAGGAGFDVVDGQPARRARGPPGHPPRRRGRHPRRRDRLRRVARVLRRSSARAAGRIPALMVVSPDARRPLDGRLRRRRGRVLHPPLLRRVAPLARRGDVHPQPDRRRRHRARSSRAGDMASTAGRPPRDRHRRLQSEGRRRQDDRRHEPRRRPPDPHGPARPARRRRHRDRPRHARRSASRRSGPSSTAGATRPRAARPRRSTDIAAAHPSGHAGRRR